MSTQIPGAQQVVVFKMSVSGLTKTKNDLTLFIFAEIRFFSNTLCFLLLSYNAKIDNNRLCFTFVFVDKNRQISCANSSRPSENDTMHHIPFFLSTLLDKCVMFLLFTSFRELVLGDFVTNTY
jgi:hypothetical protein